jgi:hypothetical protein
MLACRFEPGQGENQTATYSHPSPDKRNSFMENEKQLGATVHN